MISSIIKNYCSFITYSNLAHRQTDTPKQHHKHLSGSSCSSVIIKLQ